ncbi:DNA replication protein psf1 [Cladochytrium tenue]|nr:DNA replication protein psf1 [Cladochytrium tenue]
MAASFGDEAAKLLRELKRQPDAIPPYRDDSVRGVLAEMRHLVEEADRLRAYVRDLSVRATEAAAAGAPSQSLATLLPPSTPSSALSTQIPHSLSSSSSSSSSSSAFDSATAAVGSSASTASSGDPRDAVAAAIAAAALTIQMHELAFARNKRCLLAYHRERLDRIRAAAWELGAAGPVAAAAAAAPAAEPAAAASSSSAGSLLLPADVARSLSPSELDFLASYRGLVEGAKGAHLAFDVGGPLVPPRAALVDVRVVVDLGDVVLPSSGAAFRLAKGSQHCLFRPDVEPFIVRGYLREL